MTRSFFEAETPGNAPAPTLPDVQAYLDSFEGPAQVATQCRVQGIRGQKCSRKSCPLGRLLRAKFGGEWSVGWYICRTSGAGQEFYTIPDVLQQFISGFDSGRYPDLFD